MNLALLLRNSWGEIDWVAPVLHRLRELAPQVRISALFPADGFLEQARLYPVLRAQLEAACDAVHSPASLLGERVDWAPSRAAGDVLAPRARPLPPEAQRIDAQLRELRAQAALAQQEDPAGFEAQRATVDELERHARGALDALLAEWVDAQSGVVEERLIDAFLGAEPRGFDCVLRDHGTDLRFHRQLLERLPGVPVVRFPHGTMVQSHPALRSHPGFSTLRGSRAPDRADLFLVAREDDAEIHCHLTGSTGPVEVVGYPRYDEPWMEQTLRESGRRGGDAAARVLLITRGDFYLAREDRGRLLASALELLHARPGAHLLVKPHPRENLDELVGELSAAPRERWTLWHGSVLEAAHASALVVSFWSSGMLDGLALGRPTVELFRFPRVEEGMPDGSPITHQWIVLPDGSVTSSFRALGLAEPAASGDDLLRLYDLALASPDAPIWERQRRAFAGLHPPGADHAGRAARAILRAAGADVAASQPDPVASRAAISSALR